MKHYIDTITNLVWAFEDEVDPFSFQETPSTLILIDEPPTNRHIYENGTWVLPIEEAPIPVILTPAEKLANAGLTVDDLKSLLGL